MLRHLVIAPALALLLALPTHTGQTQDKTSQRFAAFPPVESLLAPVGDDQVEAIKVVTNLGDGYQDLGDGVIILGENGDPKEEWIGRLRLDGDFDTASIIVDDEDRTPIRFEKRSKSEFLILGTGRVYILATLVTQEPLNIEQRQFVLEIPEGDGPGPGPGPDPGPDPLPVPDDAFDNIGKRVAEWTAGLNNREAIGRAFLETAEFARSTPSATINGVQQVLADKLASVPEYSDQYDTFRLNLSTDLQQRWPLRRGVLADYYDAVAAGLGVSQ